MMPPRILGGHPKKLGKFLNISQKLETSGHQFNISNHSKHWICYLSNKLPTSAIMRILLRHLRDTTYDPRWTPKNREIIKNLTKIRNIQSSIQHIKS
jgi:hypothetical protein